MAQHDYNIENQTGLEFRADLNGALQAIATQNSGTTEPADTFPGMVWLNTSTSPPTEMRRNQTDDGWVTTLSAAGQAVAGAADAAAQRTAMGAQATLVSGDNIKTINGVALLGSGNIVISGGLNTPIATVAAGGTIDLTAGAPNTSQLVISGTGVSINGFTVAGNRFFVVKMTGASNTLVHSASLITGRGVNIPVVAGDSFLMRSTAANVVEVLCGDFLSERAIGTGQTWQTLTGSRATNTSYTNTTGRSIVVVVVGATGPYTATMTVNGIPVGQFTPASSGSLTTTVTIIVPPGGVYQMNTLGILQSWQELR